MRVNGKSMQTIWFDNELNAEPQKRNDNPTVNETIILPTIFMPLKNLVYKIINGIAIAIPITFASMVSFKQRNVPKINNRVEI